MARPGTFPKGKSGNPKGRTPLGGKELDVKLLAREFSEEAVKKLAELMRDKAAGGKVNVAAANSLLDRGHGKCAQPMEHSGNLHIPTEITIVTSLEEGPDGTPKG